MTNTAAINLEYDTKVDTDPDHNGYHRVLVVRKDDVTAEPVIVAATGLTLTEAHMLAGQVATVFNAGVREGVRVGHLLLQHWSLEPPQPARYEQQAKLAARSENKRKLDLPGSHVVIRRNTEATVPRTRYLRVIHNTDARDIAAMGPLNWQWRTNIADADVFDSLEAAQHALHQTAKADAHSRAVPAAEARRLDTTCNVEGCGNERQGFARFCSDHASQR